MGNMEVEENCSSGPCWSEEEQECPLKTDIVSNTVLGAIREPQVNEVTCYKKK